MPYSQYADIFEHPAVRKVSRAFQAKYPYKFSQDYIRYSTFADIAASILFYAQVAPITDFITHHFWKQINILDRDNTPIYALDRATLELFENSSIANRSELFEDSAVETAPISYCVLLPCGAFATGGGAHLEVLWIESLQNNTDAEIKVDFAFTLNGCYGQRIPPGARQITTTGMDTEAVMWGVTNLYPEHIATDPRIDLGSSGQTPQDVATMDRIRELSLQILLAIEYLPGSVGVTAPTNFKKGFGKTSTASTVWHPRRLRIERKQYLSSGKESAVSEGTRKSPRSHWRKYHWRRVAVGTGRSARQWRLIQRTYVNASI